MKKNYLLVSIACYLFIFTQAQNEFYISGNNNSTTTEVFVSGSDGVNPTLFVDGEIVNNQGVFVNNDGDIELTGNFTNTANGSDAYYESNGIERFSGTGNSLISGDLQGTTDNINQLYDVKINKESFLDFVSLNTVVHINRNGSLDFEGNGILRTDNSSHGNSGSNYDHYLFIQNADASAISGASLSAGTNNAFVEGRLRWRLNGTSSYAFPIGGGNNGVEPIGLDVNSADNLVIESYILTQGEIANLEENGLVYQDVGTPNASQSTIASDGCSDGADGILDKIELNVHSGIGWQINRISGFFSNYDVALSPASTNNITPYNPFSTDSDCENIELLYVSRNGIAGGDNSALIPGTQDWPSTPGYEVAPQTSTTIAGVTGFHLSGMTSFSSFGLHTTSPSGVVLPVELVFLTAYGVDNEFIQVDWTTATEINNDGFEIQRSENGIDFTTIGWVEGMGNSTNINDYSFEDFEVNKDLVYYYRLKQIDFDGAFEFSNIVSASLRGDGQFSVKVYPNPNQRGDNLNIDIYSDINTDATLNIYDMLGKVVFLDKLNLSKGKNTYHLKNSIVASGQYFVAIQMTDKLITKNIIVTD